MAPIDGTARVSPLMSSAPTADQFVAPKYTRVPSGRMAIGRTCNAGTASSSDTTGADASLPPSPVTPPSSDVASPSTDAVGWVMAVPASPGTLAPGPQSVRGHEGSAPVWNSVTSVGSPLAFL